MRNKNKEALSFELKLSDMRNTSNRLAWAIAFISLLASITIVLFYIYKPLVKTVPYVIKIDNEGVPSLLTSLSEKNIEVEEAVDKYFIKEYVVKREGYYWHFLEKDYFFVQLLSSEKMAAEYRHIYEGEKARDKLLGSNAEVEIFVEYITLAVNAGVHTATIKIKKVVKDKNSRITSYNKIITLSYFYNAKLILKEGNRLKNPLGFTVTTYRIDQEIKQ